LASYVTICMHDWGFERGAFFILFFISAQKSSPLARQKL
jgi:hypothetical protein